MYQLGDFRFVNARFKHKAGENAHVLYRSVHPGFQDSQVSVYIGCPVTFMEVVKDQSKTRKNQ